MTTRSGVLRLVGQLSLVFVVASVSFAASRRQLPTVQTYGMTPLAFEPNVGQASAGARYLARGRGMTVLFRDDDAVLALSGLPSKPDSVDNSIVRVHFRGAQRTGGIVASEKQQSVSNYLIGNEPSEWRTNVPNYGRIRYVSLYPGVDLAFYGNRAELEHDFIVAPNADYAQIRVSLDGADHLRLSPDGGLVVSTHSGDLAFHPPVIYQVKNGEKTRVRGEYVITARNEFRFKVSAYDRNRTLVIDPVLSYSTYLAGSSVDTATSIAVDGTGSAYVTGYTFSADFPLQNPEQPSCNSGCSQPDVFVTKFNPTGSALVYSTYVGGSGYDQASAISVDSSGNALVAGFTGSFDFPQKNGLGAVLGYGSNHGFAFSLNASGSGFNFSTYLGGESTDAATGIGSDSSANVYISGYTDSTNFIVTSGNQIGPPPGYFTSDLFLTKLTSAGGLIFSTLIGGNTTAFGGTFGYQPVDPISLAIDGQGEAILSGMAFSGFPTTPGAFQPNYPGSNFGSSNAFVGLLNNTGTALVYGTYLGGSGADGGDGAAQMKIDSGGDVYVTGTTGSLDFPTTTGAFQTTNLQGGLVSFVSKLDPTLSTLIYSTYLGGTELAYGNGVSATGIAVDGQGNTYISGNTNESVFPLVDPLVGQPPQSLYGASNAAFLSVLNSTGSALTFSTFFSGSVGTTGGAVAVDGSGNPYLTGTTSDPDLPTTAGAFQPTIPPPAYPIPHAFVTKISVNTPNAGACLSTSSIGFPTTEPGKSSTPFPLTVTNCGTLPLKISSVSVSNTDFILAKNGCKNIAPGSTCTMTVRYTPLIADGSDVGTLQITDNAPITPQNVTLTGYSALPSIEIYTTEIILPDEIVGLTSGPALTDVFTYGTLPLHITSVTATGDFAGVNDCPKALQPGQSCLLGATFTPTSPGVQTGTLYIYDDAPGSPQTLTLTGNGLSAYPTPTITSISPGSALAGSSAMPLFIYGTEIFPTTAVTINGKGVPYKVNSFGTLQATIPASFLKNVGSLSIQIVNPAPGGASQPVGFSVYSVTTLGAADVIYEPYTQKYYASMPSTALTNPNTLVTFDPVTGVMGSPISIGNNPGALGLSADGTILYVGLNGDNSVVPFNLMTQTAGTEIPLGSDPLKGSFTASNLQVQASNPANFVATVNAGYYGADGVEWIRNGSVVSQFLDEPPNNVALGGTRFVNPSNLYGWQSSYGSTGLLRFVIGSKGMLEAQGINGLFGIGAFDTDGVNLYDVDGQVFNATTGALLGTFAQINNYSPESAVLTDLSSGRTFFLDAYNGVLAFDDSSFAEVGTIGSIPVTSPSNRLQRWGPDGLSALTFNYSSNGYDLILLRSNLFYPVIGPNPVPTAKSLNPTAVTAGGKNFNLVVNGLQFVQGAVVLWNNSSRATTWVNGNKLIADIPASDIATSGSAKITVLNPAPGGGKSQAITLTIQ